MERRDWTSSNNWSYSIITCLFGLGEYMLGQDFIRDTHLAGHSRVLVFAVILLVEPADHVVTAFLRLLHHGAAQLHILVWVGWIGDSQGDSSLSLEHPVFDPASRGVDNEVRPVPCVCACVRGRGGALLSLIGMFTNLSNANIKVSSWLLKGTVRSEEHTSELQSPTNLVCRLLLAKKKY